MDRIANIVPDRAAEWSWLCSMANGGSFQLAQPSYSATAIIVAVWHR